MAPTMKNREATMTDGSANPTLDRNELFSRLVESMESLHDIRIDLQLRNRHRAHEQAAGRAETP